MQLNLRAAEILNEKFFYNSLLYLGLIIVSLMISIMTSQLAAEGSGLNSFFSEIAQFQLTASTGQNVTSSLQKENHIFSNTSSSKYSQNKIYSSSGNDILDTQTLNSEKSADVQEPSLSETALSIKNSNSMEEINFTIFEIN